jgi:predicted membrane protein
MESKIKPNMIVGIVVIIIGSLFLLKNFGIFPPEFLWKIISWQTILIVIGTVFYFNSNKSVGVTLIVVGALSWIPDIWPILIILLGLYIVIKNKTNFFNKNEQEPINDNFDPNQKIYDTSLFGGGKKSFQIDNFKGGNVTSIFGGSEIDLMDCTLANGTNRLELFFLFGGSSLKIPSNWNVLIQLTPIFGGFSDKRTMPQSQVFDNSKTLIISGIVVFGGGELTNYVKF